MTEVCVDAGLVVKLVTQEPDSDQVDALFAQWQSRKTRLIAPAFAITEIDSVLRQKVHRGELTADMADRSFAAACQVPVRTPTIQKLRRRTWEIAKQFQFPQVYDSAYLALADLRGCEFWTADRKLYERVKERLGFIRHVSDWR
jgi:predicted nucleic acid-binding protein